MCFTTFLAPNRLVVVRRRPEGSAADSHAGRAAKCRVIKGEKELQVPDSQVEQKSNFNDYCWLFKSVLLFVLALCGNRFQCASVVVLITVHPIVPSFSSGRFMTGNYHLGGPLHRPLGLACTLCV